MASYNGDQFIQEQIETILDQKEVTIDLYISDDGSSDKTVLIIQSLQKKFTNIHLLKQHPNNLGPGNNFYRLIKSLDINRYDFVALSDQDDIWPEYKLSRAVEMLEKSGSVGYSSDVMTFEGNQECTTYLRKSYPQKKYDYLFEGPGPGCTFVLSKHFFIELKNFLLETETDFLYHDWLIYALARSNNHTWFIDDTPNLFYRQHASNFLGANQGFLAAVKRASLVLNGGWGRDINLLFDLLDVSELKVMSRKQRRIFFLRHFFQTRRRWSHTIMYFFFFLLGIQK